MVLFGFEVWAAFGFMSHATFPTGEHGVAAINKAYAAEKAAAHSAPLAAQLSPPDVKALGSGRSRSLEAPNARQKRTNEHTSYRAAQYRPVEKKT